MGHDITAYTRSGNEIRGPYFTRFWWPHYDYLDAHHHNDGISGDGKDEEMTPERLQTALQRVEEDLVAERESLREIEDRICGFQTKASAELRELAAQREVLQAELQASEELRELNAQLEAIRLERLRYSPWRNDRMKIMGMSEWLKTGECAEWRRLGEHLHPIVQRIEEINAPLSQIEQRIAEIEPFASDFKRAVLERQKREAMGRRKPGVPYILAPCPDDPGGDWMPVPLQDLTSSGVDDEDDEEKPRDEGLSAVQHMSGCRRTIKVYEELRDFFNRCIEEDVVRMRFW